MVHTKDASSENNLLKQQNEDIADGKAGFQQSPMQLQIQP